MWLVVVRVDVVLGRPKAAAEAILITQTRCHHPRGRGGGAGTFIAGGGTADETDGADITLQPLLPQGGAEVIAAGITVQASRGGFVGDSVPVRVDQGQWSGARLGKICYRATASIAGVMLNVTSCFSIALMGRTRVGCLRQEIAAAANRAFATYKIWLGRGGTHEVNEQNTITLGPTQSETS